MPIPPRPIPQPNRSRPGTSVPRKSLPLSNLHTLDWRSELALLNDLPRSAPSNPGIRVVEKARVVREKVEAARDRGEASRREVDLGGLITEGKGRVKRATTALSLGFDFVVNPTVLALPDDTASSSVIPTSLLTASKGIKSRHCPALSPSPAATALSRSPGTPALLPTHLAEDDDEGWEHIPSSPHHSAEGDRDEEMSEDEDVIVLGELELEDELEELDLSREVKGEKERRGTKGLSYAAALEGKA